MSRALLVTAFFAAALLAAGARAADAAPEDPWRTRLPAFAADAPPRGEAPILLYFTAPWCGFCKQMERGALADAEVRAAVSRLRAHKLDFDAQRGLVERFGVRGIPAFVLTNDRGEVIRRLTGASEKAVFLKWLREGEAEASRVALGAEERRKALAALYKDLYSEDEAVRDPALRAFWDVLARGDEAEKKAARESLSLVQADIHARVLARRQFWLIGLGHSDLAVRVEAANLLRTTKPEQAKLYDPWAEEPARAEAISQLAW